MKKINLRLILSILFPLLTGGLSALISKKGIQAFSLVNKPPLTPPSFVFPIVWTILYALMGISFYIALSSPKGDKKNAVKVYLLQLFFNFFWTPLFFNAKLYFIAFVWLICLIAAILAMIFEFNKLSSKAAKLQIPYLIWCCFAAYLNFGVFLAN